MKNVSEVTPVLARRGGRGVPGGEDENAREEARAVASEPANPVVLLLASAGGEPLAGPIVAPAVENASPAAAVGNGWALAGGAVVFGALAGAARKSDETDTESVPVDHTAPTATVSHPGDSALVLELLNVYSVDAGKGPLVDTPMIGFSFLVGGTRVTLTSLAIKSAGQGTQFRTEWSDLADYTAFADAFRIALADAGYDGSNIGKPLVSVRVGSTFDTVHHLTGAPILGIGYQLVFQSEAPAGLSVEATDIWQFDAGIPAIVTSHERIYAKQVAFTGPVPFTISFDEPVSGLTLDDFAVSGGTKLALSGTGASYTLTVLPNANAQGTLSVHLPPGAVHDAAGNGNATAVEESVLFDTRNASYTPGQPMIDLGVYGRLIAPVQSDGGAWYYYWDRSGDGGSADQGVLNGGHDAAGHDELDALFVLDAAGQIGGGGNTSDSIRYASLNGVKLALPTTNGGASLPADIGHPQPGTEIDNRPTGEPNVTYSDLLAVWDGHNGSATATGQSGLPPGWAGGLYWSATSSANGHLGVDLLTGTVFDDLDARTAHVAVWVV